MLLIDLYAMDRQNRLRLAEINRRANQLGPIYAALPAKRSRPHLHLHLRLRVADGLTAMACRLDPALCALRPRQAAQA